jgi:hypothetical protein
MIKDLLEKDQELLNNIFEVAIKHFNDAEKTEQIVDLGIKLNVFENPYVNTCYYCGELIILPNKELKLMQQGWAHSEDCLNEAIEHYLSRCPKEYCHE